MKLLDYFVEHKIKTILIILFIVIIPIVTVNLLFKITAPYPWLEAEFTSGELLSYMGSVTGAVATLLAVVLTIVFTVENQKREKKLSLKPILDTEHNPKFARIDQLIVDGVIYVQYPFPTNGGVASSLNPAYPIKQIDIKDQAAIAKFYQEYYIILYEVKNIGAGNAANVEFSIDGFPVIPPFSLTRESLKEFMIIFGAEILVDGDKEVTMSFEYTDIESLGKYKQQEEIILIREENNSLSSSQKLNGVLSTPVEI
jgi:fumarate reductase subunit D